jgi:ubiquinone biosynthesis protein COQ9
LMQPYKPALKRISSYLCCRPGEAAPLLCGSLASQYWMLAGSGAKLDGPAGAVRVAGLAAIYGKVFRVWLDDQSPSLDKTMAALDQRLARGERMLSAVEQACHDACRLACAFMPRGWTRSDRAEPSPQSPGPASSPVQ